MSAAMWGMRHTHTHTHAVGTDGGMSQPTMDWNARGGNDTRGGPETRGACGPHDDPVTTWLRCVP